jgi:hypothetical protein
VEVRVDTLRRLVRQAGMELWAADLLSLTAGVAAFPENGDTPETLVAEAEQRMLAARRSKMRSTGGSAAESLVSGSLARMTDSIERDSLLPQSENQPTTCTESR